tara:strand:+ start:425 stop:802 length:378 start_codon:yes stop_codon:yes gene_type:complete
MGLFGGNETKAQAGGNTLQPKGADQAALESGTALEGKRGTLASAKSMAVQKELDAIDQKTSGGGHEWLQKEAAPAAGGGGGGGGDALAALGPEGAMASKLLGGGSKGTGRGPRDHVGGTPSIWRS